MTAPIMSNGYVTEIVTVARTHKSSFNDRDLNLLKAFTFCASLIGDNNRDRRSGDHT